MKICFDVLFAVILVCKKSLSRDKRQMAKSEILAGHTGYSCAGDVDQGAHCSVSLQPLEATQQEELCAGVTHAAC